MRATAILCVRNEGAFLLEWLAHHRGVGFTDFLVFSNDCDDGTDAILDRLEALGELTHLRNDGPHEGGVQWAAMKIADKHPLVKNADWLMTLDIDEFVNIHVGDHTLASLIATLPDADAITLTWRLFGNCGIERFEDRPVTEVFTHAAPAVMYWPWRAHMFKTLYRNTGAYRKLGVHRPRSPVDGKADATRWFDGEGRALETRFRRQQIFSPFGRSNIALAQLNHYALGAMESYIVKRDRGRAVHGADKLGLDYWSERNWCNVEDSSIRQCDRLRDDRLARLKADPTLARLHAQAVTWRQDRFHQLMQEEPFRALYGRLLMSPPAQPIPIDRARFLFSFAQQSRGKQRD
ncbi:glycosyltransferase family 2 protein [Aliiroseovarius subalbicans]|uniref:glycosyltransferase family 2 protein n=1 Tax=Aliiroseovarius subalbicans TaxID=2925840 RepID=UPI001F5A7877|nr:glycosyltransferase family 2 protein [Aliiroseovarius subalbicans]MCI2398853.1 glycosyltransferase family 2 protein [Aliiroseovarius subalbicans]